MSEWNLDQGDFHNVMSSGLTEVNLDRGEPDTLEVVAEQGSGYLRTSITTYIPMDMLVKLMEHAGYTVTREGGQ